MTLDASGAASLRMNDYMGPVLLSGTSSNPDFLTLQVASDGRLATSVVDNDGTTRIVSPSGGTLAGLVDASSSIAGRRQQLDGLAGSFVTQLNNWQAQGNNGYGVSGGALLSGTDAASIQLNSTDPLAIAATGNGTENGNLLVLTGLRGADGVEAGWRGIVTDQALMVSAAKTEATAASTRKDSAYSALDDVSGVDLDTEAAQLLRFQQAYSASAKIIQAGRETLQSILDLF